MTRSIQAATIALCMSLVACAPAPTAEPRTPAGGPTTVPPTAGSERGSQPPSEPPSEPPTGPPEPSSEPPSAATELVDTHPVSAVALSGTVAGRKLTVRVEWWSVVDACSALVGVDIERHDSVIALTVREGHPGIIGHPGVWSGTCIELAVHKTTDVDLGELEPGPYTITAHGTASPLLVMIPD